MAQYLLLVYDVPGHLAEETKHASWSVPRAICATFFSGAAMNFALILAFLYSIQIEPNVTVPGCGITGVRYQGSGTGTTFTSTDEKDAPIYYTLFLFSNIVYDAFAARFPDREAQLADSSCTLQYSNLGGFCVVPGLCDVNGNCAPDTLGPDGTPSGCPLRGNHKARQGAVFLCAAPRRGVCCDLPLSLTPPRPAPAQHVHHLPGSHRLHDPDPRRRVAIHLRGA